MMFPVKNQPILARPPPPLYSIPMFLYMAALLVLVTGEPYNATDHISLACGSSGHNPNVDFDNRTWSGDTNPQYAPLDVGNLSQVGSAPPRPTKQVPYGTARLSHSNFTYSFHVTAGLKFIRLYFNPDSYGPTFDRSNSLFSVTAGSFTLLKDFNASVNADFDNTTYFLREFCVNVEAEAEQRLNITFIPSKLANKVNVFAFINGIEIISMPTNLYYGREAKYVGNDILYSVDNSTAMGMIFRINVGGKPISPNEDTGMYRNWDGSETELSYLDKESMRHSLTPTNTSNQLKFTRETPEYVAPKLVYQTGRSMGNNNTINLSYNLTWNFPVDSGFNYLVRLHFCEFEPLFFNRYDRVFVIYINNILVEKNVDIIEWSGDNGIPVYRDYYIPILRQESQDVADISIALHPYPHLYYSRYRDALLNGLEIFKLNDSNGNLGGPNPTPRGKSQENPTFPSSLRPKKSKTMLAIISGAVVSGILVLCVLGILIFRRGRKVKGTSSSQSTKWGPFSFATTKSTKSRGSSLPSDLCRHFSLAEIISATQNFNEAFIIGVGGFGHVYKGHVDDGSTPVAIKRLKPESSQGANEFETEIEMLSQLRHLHLVSLVGYCTEQKEMILVYDYMTHGTLREHLYGTAENPPLPWEQRLQICIGAARGLHYLHTGAKCMIIHRDVKSTNILLDEKWTAKVSDFGLSKMRTTTMSKAHISTMVKGSFGYLDPEYYRRQQLTEKSDVYSFGVVLCEVLCARPALMRSVEKKQMNLAEWTKICHRNGTISQIMDPKLRGKIVATCLNKYIELALSCMSDNGNERPSMNDVVWGLEFALQLQQSAEAFLDFDTEKKGEDVVALIKSDSEVGFSSSNWEDLSGSSTSRTTKSSSEQLSITNESVKGMSGTIFSEIKDPTAR